MLTEVPVDVMGSSEIGDIEFDIEVADDPNKPKNKKPNVKSKGVKNFEGETDPEEGQQGVGLGADYPQTDNSTDSPSGEPSDQTSAKDSSDEGTAFPLESTDKTTVEGITTASNPIGNDSIPTTPPPMATEGPEGPPIDTNTESNENMVSNPDIVDEPPTEPTDQKDDTNADIAPPDGTSDESPTKESGSPIYPIIIVAVIFNILILIGLIW